MKKGFFRLWIVLAFIVVPALAIWQNNNTSKVWEGLDKSAVKICSDREDRETAPSFDFAKCLRESHVGEPVFARENTTFRAYWGGLLGISFVAYLFFTGLMAGIFYVIRWVIRGFSPHPRSNL